MAAERVEVPHTYQGFRGLFTQHIPAFVMSQEENMAFFRRHNRYETAYAYPCAVSDALESVFFSMQADEGEQAQGNTLIIKAENTSNSSTHLCLNTIGSFILPRQFIVRDRLRFFNEQGFGEGSSLITTLDCVAAEDAPGCMTRFKVMIANQSLPVTDRPALFLKVAINAEHIVVADNPMEAAQGQFYNDIAVFFPAQVGGYAHSVVQHGEAFVLIPEGHELSEQEIESIARTFHTLVDTRAYADNGSLCAIGTVEPIDARQPQNRP